MTKQLKKILVANRGEVAVRIIRACRELGIEAVAIYSDIDRLAPHVHMADEAYRVGPPPASESYLMGDKIIEVAKKCGADGIHPGYGFLSESYDFAKAVEDAGLVWVGPPSESIRVMGDKVAARETMAAAGVPLVPGLGKSGQLLSDEELIVASEKVGFPLLVKAAGGGGGKGMRNVSDPADLPEAIRTARREAEAAFGDNRVYLEKFIENARHIEIQILGDTHGHIIHLGERECSIQRRHQKLIEEAPSPVVDEATRQEMGKVAIKAAQAVDYYSAGTIEFVMDQDKNYYFLEMNTRLQVEHPVTEAVTGIDIVKEMIRIAAGEKLRYQQSDIEMNGTAIECRIIAEDPRNNFMPSIGKIVGLTKPDGPGVRLDSTLEYGVEITPHYDSLVAKLIVWAETRAEAIVRMRRALQEFVVVGVKTTIPLHIQLINSDNFQTAAFDTTFLETRFEFNRIRNPEHQWMAAVAATMMAHERSQRAITLQEDEPSPWRLYGRREALDRRLR